MGWREGGEGAKEEATKGEKGEEGEKEGKVGSGAAGERERDSNCHLGKAERHLSGVWESNRSIPNLKCHAQNNRVYKHYVQMEWMCPAAGATPASTAHSSHPPHPSKLP